jgi:4-amino-4-deoxy-L-arabinose transferase-like glycosyltransferase
MNNSNNRFFSHRREFFVWIALFSVVGASAFWNLGAASLHDWDESRHGQNAIEMLRSGQWFHYTYDNKPDLWNSKPALGIWSIALSFKAFGYNAFALRFPSACAALISCIFVALLTSRFLGQRTAQMATFILATSAGIFGFHTGRTGDLDALLVAGLTGTVYFWARYEEERKQTLAALSGILWGVAFLSKGIAAVVILPGLFLHSLIVRRKKLFLSFQRRDMTGPLVALLFPVFWFALQNATAPQKSSLAPFNTEVGGQTTSWQVMIFYDTWQRFTSNIEGHGNSWDFYFVFKQWDVYFGPWIYLLYIGILILSYLKMSNTRTPSPIERVLSFLRSVVKRVRDQENGSEQPARLTQLCLLVILPLLLLLTLARSKLPWYIAPSIPFLSILLSHVIRRVFSALETSQFARRRLHFIWLGLCLAVAFAATVRIFKKHGATPDVALEQHLERLAQQRAQGVPFCYASPLRQSHRLALSFISADLNGWSERSELLPTAHRGLAMKKSSLPANGPLRSLDLTSTEGCVLVWSEQ